MTRLISLNSINLSYLCIIVSVILLFISILGIYLNSLLFISIPLVGCAYLVYVALLYEIRINEQEIIINHLYYGTKLYKKDEFISISQTAVGPMRINLQDGHGYSFMPKLTRGFLKYTTHDNYVKYWTKELSS